MKISNCTMCKRKQKIVYQDWKTAWSHQRDYAFLKLCYSCCKEFMPEEVPKDINGQLLNCQTCNKLFLPNQGWEVECFKCWVKVQKPKAKAILKKTHKSNIQQTLGGLLICN